MSTRALLLATVTFGIGLLCGWWLAQAPAPTADLQPRVTASPMAPQAATPAKRQPSTVWLTVEFDQNTRLVAGTRIAGTNVLLASLPAVYPARAVYIRGTDDAAPVFPKVVAADGVNQLIAFEYSDGAGYDLSQQTGTLFLGRDLRLRWPNQTLSVSVATPLRQNRRGHSFFEVGVHQSYEDRGGPLLDEQGVLLGLLLNNVHRETVDEPNSTVQNQLAVSSIAIDATSIRDFLDRPRFEQTMDMRQFSQFWASTPDGLSSDALRLAEVKRWVNAYNKMQQLWDSAGNLNLFQQDLYTLSAYLAAHQMIEQDNPQQALNLLDTMQINYPNNQPWCYARTLALEIAERFADTVNSARRCLLTPNDQMGKSNTLGLAVDLRADSQISPTTLRDAALRAALAFARDTSASRDARYTILQDVLSVHPHAEVYRALGDLDYNAQRYALARGHYRQAIDLDPSLSAELEPRLRNSTQRAETAPLAEVPYEKNRGSIVIDLSLNNSSQTFRFLVDTGATYTALSTETLLRLGLNDIFARGAPTIELQSANGPIYVQRFTLDAVTVGNATVNNVPVVLLEDFGRYDGLLGLSFLRHFDVNLDQQAGKLILTRR